MNDIGELLMVRYLRQPINALPFALTNWRYYITFTHNIVALRRSCDMFMNKAGLEENLARALAKMGYDNVEQMMMLRIVPVSENEHTIIAIYKTLNENAFCKYCLLMGDNCYCDDLKFDYYAPDDVEQCDDWAANVNARLIAQ